MSKKFTPSQRLADKWQDQKDEEKKIKDENEKRLNEQRANKTTLYDELKNDLDKKFSNGKVTQEKYNKEIAKLDRINPYKKV